jgi:thiamine biosynthesis protein ThiS
VLKGTVLTLFPVEITVNGARRVVPDELTVRGLVEHLRLTEGPVAVEINRAIISRARHPEHPVVQGDVVEIVHFVGGG